MVTIIKTLPDIALLGNLPDIVISANKNVVMKVKLGSKNILSEEIVPAAKDGIITIKVKEIVTPFLTLSIPDKNFYKQIDAAKIFTFIFDEEKQVTCKIVLGGVDADIDNKIFLKANWLTWQAQQKNVKYYDPEWLSYYAVCDTKVKLKAYFKDGTDKIIDYAELKTGWVWTLNVMFSYISEKFEGQPVYFDIWTENNEGDRMSFLQRYVLIDTYYEFDDLFIYANSLGGIDTIRFTGSKDEIPEFNFESAELAETEEQIDYNFETNDFIKKNTGFLVERCDRQRANEFINSPLRYYLQEGVLKRITISDVISDVKLNDFSTFFYEFTFRTSTRTKYLNISRRDKLPKEVEIIDPESKLFFLAPRLNEFPTAEISSSLLFLVQNPFSSQWKKVSYADLIDGISSLLSDVVGSSHVHLNKKDLDKLKVELGYLLADGKKIKAGDSDSLGGRDAKAYWHVDNANKKNVDWKMQNAIIHKCVTSPEYSSGFGGTGWRIDPGTNGLTIDCLTVRKQMDIYETEINKIRAANGSIWISDSAKIKEVIDEGDVWKCLFDCDKENIANPFRQKDWIRCQQWTGRCVKYYSTKVTRIGEDFFCLTKLEVDGDGVPAAGDTVVRIGNEIDKSRQGAIYMSSSDVCSPFIDLIDGVKNASLDGKTKVRIGKLDGINSPVWGKLNGYGIHTSRGYFENVDISGRIYITGGNAATVNSVDTAIKGIEIGGTNLLKISDYENWGGVYLISNKEFSFNIYKTYTLFGKGTDNVFPNINFAPNTQYTFSLLSKNKQTDGRGGIFYIRYTDGSHYDAMPLYATTYKSFIFTSAKNKTIDRITFSYYGSGVQYIKNFKIEKGNKSTDWSPAPEDINAAAENYAKAKAELVETTAKAYADGIVTAEEKRAIQDAQEKANTTKLEAKAYADGKVDALCVGGTNLLKDTKINETTGGYTIHKFYLTTSPKEGDTYTFTLKGELGSDRKYFMLYNSGSWVHMTNITPEADYKGNDLWVKTFKWVIKRGGGTANNTSVFLYQATSSGASKSTIEWVKLEKGNKATDWSPAPEDAEKAITDLEAAKQDAIIGGKTLIQGGYLNTDFIETGVITADKIKAGTITADKIKAGTITGDRIKASTITGDKIKTDTIEALGNVTAGTFNLGNNKFKVDTEGKLTASDATITGDITAVKGKIGNFEITGGATGEYGGLIADSDEVLIRMGRTSGDRNVFIGTEVFPAHTSERSVSIFKNIKANDYSTNYAVYAKARNTGRKQNKKYKNYYAGYFDGHLRVVNGIISGRRAIDINEWSHLADKDNAYMTAGFNFFLGDKKTRNRKYYLPHAYAYEEGELITITNYNDHDAYILPRSGENINGYQSNRRWIKLRNPADNVTLRSNGASQWIIVSAGGSGFVFD